MYVSLDDAAKLAEEHPEMLQQYCVARVVDMLKLTGECVLKGAEARKKLTVYMRAENLTETDVTWHEATNGTPYLRVETDQAHPYRIAYLHPPKMDIMIYEF